MKLSIGISGKFDKAARNTQGTCDRSCLGDIHTVAHIHNYNIGLAMTGNAGIGFNSGYNGIGFGQKVLCGFRHILFLTFQKIKIAFEKVSAQATGLVKTFYALSADGLDVAT